MLLREHVGRVRDGPPERGTATQAGPIRDTGDSDPDRMPPAKAPYPQATIL
jgi:hypothetical protein